MMLKNFRRVVDHASVTMYGSGNTIGLRTRNQIGHFVSVGRTFAGTPRKTPHISNIGRIGIALIAAAIGFGSGAVRGDSSSRAMSNSERLLPYPTYANTATLTKVRDLGLTPYLVAWSCINEF